MAYPLYLVDAFATGPFTGNPAAVCLLADAANERWMQQVAMEMNQAETAFLFPENSHWRLRWFTPSNEVDLCGHATLASAHILWQTGRLNQSQEAVFQTKSGRLSCTRTGESIEMDFPAEPPTPFDAPSELRTALSAEPVYIGKNRMDILVELPTEDEVRSLQPDLNSLARLDTRGVIVTARASNGADFMSRFFAPAFGVPEDHATGSAHCCLGPYWAEKLGKQELRAVQASPRGAAVGVAVTANRVRLSGRAYTVLAGELNAG